MSKKARSDNPATAIKSGVERRAGKRNETGRDAADDPGFRKLLHELEVHQLELESQNAELRVARNEAEAAGERYSDLYDFAPVGYFALDTAGTIQMANLTAASLVAIDRSSLVGRSFVDLVSPPCRNTVTTFLGRVFASSGKQSIEIEFLGKNRRPKFVAIEAQSGPESHQCRVVVLDITERRQAEEKLRQNDAIVSSLLEHAPVGVFVVDSALRVVRINAVAEHLLGPISLPNPRELMEILDGIWTKRVSNPIVDRIRHTLETGRPYVSPGFRARRRDSGATEEYEWQIQRLALLPGEIGVVCFISDVTARNRVEAAQRRLEVLAATNEALKVEIAKRKRVASSLRKAKRKLSGMLEIASKQHDRVRELSRCLLVAEEQERRRISHELHDVVVQSLIGVSFQLSAIDASGTGDLRKLRKRIKRAHELVSSSTEIVHGFARDLRPTLLDDLGLIPALKSLVRTFTDDTGVAARLNLDVPEASLDGGERATIYRVAQAALANVARHANANQIVLNLRMKAGGVFLEISDNGQGFDPAIVDEEKRTGRIGLLGMRERVEMIGGVFTVDSKPGKGTTITVALPSLKGRGGAGST